MNKHSNILMFKHSNLLKWPLDGAKIGNLMIWNSSSRIVKIVILMGIWHEIRSATYRNDVFRTSLFSSAKNNMFARQYKLTQLQIREITNIAQKLKMLDTEEPFKFVFPCFFRPLRRRRKNTFLLHRMRTKTYFLQLKSCKIQPEHLRQRSYLLDY